MTKAIWRGTNAIDSWAWKNCDGNKAEVEVYADAYVVELFVNAKLLGKQKLKAYKATYKTRLYAPLTKGNCGLLKRHHDFRTRASFGNRQDRIALKPKATEIRPGEIVYINVDLVGENGVVESNDDRELTVTIEGGTLLGFDSGCYTTYLWSVSGLVRTDGARDLTVRAVRAALDTAEARMKLER